LSGDRPFVEEVGPQQQVLVGEDFVRRVDAGDGVVLGEDEAAVGEAGRRLAASLLMPTGGNRRVGERFMARGSGARQPL
jgi:hypothetical protein